jgi:hypothetical protein
MKFSELKNYLYDNSCFGFTATRRKKVIIYFFRRFFIGRYLTLKVKVDRKTKNVISTISNGKVYCSFNELKKLVEN